MKMNIDVIEVFYGTKRHSRSAMEFCEAAFTYGSGRHVALQALCGSPDVRMLVALSYGVSQGALSSRICADGTIQCVHLGALYSRRGTGRALINYLHKCYFGFNLWLKARPDAVAFYTAMGYIDTGEKITDLHKMTRIAETD